MRRFLLPVLALAVLAGCVTSTVAFDPADAGARQRLTERAAHQPATVTVRGRPPAAARALSVRADSSDWMDAATGERRTVATGEIEAVAFPASSKSPLAPLAVGLGGGAAAGAALGAATYDGPDFLTQSRASRAAWIGGMVGVVGGLVGGVMAIERTGTDRYVAEPARR